MKNFGLIGAAGYIAPRHMEAILTNECQLVAALDPNDSVGQMDRFFPKALFFTDFERFERFVNKQNSSPDPLHYLSICSPNHLHDTHARFALKNNMHAICEKPLVLNPWNLDALQETEQKTSRNIYNILQLRLHPAIIDLKTKVSSEKNNKRYTVNLNYITSRGPWYHISWKGDESKSGGIASNIGIHLFDMLMWVFGKVKSNKVFERNKTYAAGCLELESADVNWFLSVDSKHLQQLGISDRSVHRSLRIDDEEIDFTEGFDRLHIASYEAILNGNGFSTDDVRDSIELIHDIRNTKLSIGRSHPIMKMNIL